MRFLLDESAGARLAAYLTREGHEVTTIARDYAQGLTDRAVLAIAHAERRILITNDRDFGELVFRERQPHSGVILFRLTSVDLGSKIARLADLLARYGGAAGPLPRGYGSSRAPAKVTGRAGTRDNRSASPRTSHLTRTGGRGSLSVE